ncbi:hypothetical protein [Gloeobacter kilaueensis]|uniref:Uncharacterized protein n=1 Tax=Gloeobacter kilaueensis (strain ATCC BAA-2537 / CCAP 1431/1 / ULC 316 / JS1) TaxID=1183438 RepID=U5QKE6_GLOK1|nr:hypothetical protein [Gloeobacter kilaueensis]AGY58099.1 hypothetical protein GKIL_1853 [Gloeobacter kilaueensis JS1]
MDRLLYESSVSYRGFLIVPFRYATAAGATIYSYGLLCALGYRSRWHRSENPAGLFSSTLAGIGAIAREHLDCYGDILIEVDHFARRYVYCDNLIVVCQIGEKFFYDHYLPTSLEKIAAPRLFGGENECLEWIRRGIDRLQTQRASDTV